MTTRTVRPLSTFVVAAGLAVGASACSDDGPGEAPATTVTEMSTPTAMATIAVDELPDPSLADPTAAPAVTG